MKPAQTLEGYGYYRWSSSVQNDGDSKARQLENINRFAEQRGIKLLGIYGDEAVSAKDGKNLQGHFAKMLSVIKPGQCIVLENSDRYSRQDAIDSLYYLKHEVILKKDCIVFTVQDGQRYDKETIGNLGVKVQAFLQSELAHQENKKRIERVQSFFLRARDQIANGVPVNIGGRLPSWITTKETDKGLEWIFNEEKKLVVQRIFQEYLSGKGMRTIALGLNKENIPALKMKNRKGRKSIWSVSTIAGLLRAETVLGHLRWRKKKSNQEEHVIKNAFPAIITEKNFNDVKVKLSHKPNRGKSKDEHRVSNIFRGVTYCKHCGGGLMVEKCVGKGYYWYKGVKTKKKSPDKTYHYFCCFQARQGKCSAKKRINAERIEKAFFVDCLASPPSDLFTKENKEGLAKVAALEVRLQEIDKKVDNYLELMENGLDFSKVQTRLAEFKETKEQIKKELEEAQMTVSGVSQMPEALRSFNELLDEDLTSHETRLKIVKLMPYLVKRVEFDLGGPEDWHPDFTVTFINGVKWNWSTSADEMVFEYKGKKRVMVDSIHEPVDGIWGSILALPSPAPKIDK